jgi:hypothetical protein
MTYPMHLMTEGRSGCILQVLEGVILAYRIGTGEIPATYRDDEDHRVSLS